MIFYILSGLKGEIRNSGLFHLCSVLTSWSEPQCRNQQLNPHSKPSDKPYITPANTMITIGYATVPKLLHCNENCIYIFLFWELHGLSHNFHIHVSVSDLCIPGIGPHISCRRIDRSIVGIYKSLTDTCMGKLGLWLRNSFFRIFGLVSLQCAEVCSP